MGHRQEKKHITRRELEAQIAQTQASLKQKVGQIADELSGDMHSALSHVETGVSKVTETLETQIRGVSDRLHGAMTELRTAVDVPRRVQAEPFKMLGFAVLGGGLLGWLSGRRTGAIPAVVTSQRQATGTAGPAALLGLGVTLLRPLLVSATKELVSRGMGRRVEADRHDKGAFQDGTVYYN